MVNKKLYLLLLILILPIIVLAIDYESNSYFSYGTITDNNASIGFGQIFIGNFTNIFEGIFYIQGNDSTTLNITCSITHLNLCLNNYNCSSIGGYWYDNICHDTREPDPGAGGGGIPPSNLPRFNIYPTLFNETLSSKTILNRIFFIENYEYGTPLTITIETNLNVYNKVFEVAPGKVVEVSFDINGYNKSGYYTDNISIKISKSPNSYIYSYVIVKYNVTNTGSIINIIPSISQNKTLLDILLKNSTGEPNPVSIQLSKTSNFINTLISSPLFIICLISLLAIIIIIVIQLRDSNINDNPILYLFYLVFIAGIGLFVWFLINNDTITKLYTTPLFNIILACILFIMLITILQMNGSEESNSFIKYIIIIGIIMLFIILFRNNLLSKYSSWFTSTWFYIVLVSIISIIFIMIIQWRKR